MNKTSNKIENLKIRLVCSSDIVNGPNDTNAHLGIHQQNEVKVSCLNTLTLKGSNRNEPFNVLPTQDENSWFNNLKLYQPPFFLRKYLKNEDKHIYVCHHSLLKDLNLQSRCQDIQEVLSFKFLLRKLEKLYGYAEGNGAQGVLFMLPDEECEILEPFEELFTYIAPQLDMYGERSYWYLPTDQSAYDAFVELSEMMNHELDQWLWREQRVNSALRHYFQNMND